MSDDIQYWEDMPLGGVTKIGSHTFTEDEILTFAKKFDPKPIHVDKSAATQGPHGELAASGFHITSVWMRLIIEKRAADLEKAKISGEKSRAVGGISPGFLDLKWPNPVHPGDTVTFESEPIEKIELNSRKDMGIIRTQNYACNQSGDLVMEFKGQGFIPRRPKEQE